MIGNPVATTPCAFPEPGFGIPCPHLQSDGAPCPQTETDCEECRREKAAREPLHARAAGARDA